MGSSKRTMPGSFIRVRASSTRWRSPAERVGSWWSARRPQRKRSSSDIARARSASVYWCHHGRQRGVARGHHDLGRRHARLEAGRERRRRERDPLAQGAHVAAAEALAEHVDGAARRMLVERRDPQQRGLARAVRARARPSARRGRISQVTSSRMRAPSMSRRDVRAVQRGGTSPTERSRTRLSSVSSLLRWPSGRDDRVHRRDRPGPAAAAARPS